MRRGTDRQTDTQTGVTTIHFASSMRHTRNVMNGSYIMAPLLTEKRTVEGVQPSRKMLVCTLLLEARANSAVTQPFPLNHTCSCRSHRLAIFRSDVSVGHYFNCHENTAQFRLRTALVTRLIVSRQSTSRDWWREGLMKTFISPE